MWSERFRIVSVLAIPLAMVLLAGCGEMSKDEARKEVHQRVDKLAERLGTNRTVHGDGPAGMVPDAPTLNYSYTVRVDVDPKEALDVLRGPIADEMRDNGWSVSEKPNHNGVAYGHDDGRAFAITVSFKHDYVTLTGETPFDNPESL